MPSVASVAGCLILSDESELAGDMSPDRAASYATGDLDLDPGVYEGAAGSGHAAAEGVEPPEPPGQEPFWYRALRNTSPNPPIESVGSLRDIRENWESYGLRGLQKLGGVDDAEAWVDLVKFALGAALELQSGGEDSGSREEAYPTGPRADTDE